MHKVGKYNEVYSVLKVYYSLACRSFLRSFFISLCLSVNIIHGIRFVDIDSRPPVKSLTPAGHLIKYAYFSKCYLEQFASISAPEKWTTNVAQRKKQVKRDFK